MLICFSTKLTAAYNKHLSMKLIMVIIVQEVQKSDKKLCQNYFLFSLIKPKRINTTYLVDRTGWPKELWKWSRRRVMGVSKHSTIKSAYIYTGSKIVTTMIAWESCQGRGHRLLDHQPGPHPQKWPAASAGPLHTHAGCQDGAQG